MVALQRWPLGQLPEIVPQTLRLAACPHEAACVVIGAGAKPKSRPASVSDTDESFFDRLAERSLALAGTREALQIPKQGIAQRTGAPM